MKTVIIIFTALISSLAMQSCNSSIAHKVQNESATEVLAVAALADSSIEKITKTEAEWKAQLTKEEFYILRQKGTERSFTGKYWDNKKEGVYHCATCQLPLFDSKTKFRSGTGWPSFFAPIKSLHVTEYTDNSHGMVRTEVTCGRCDGHLGHVFPDGPQPTGLRYCINSTSLDFKEIK